ncbi:2-dehydro-3-deoxygalactonokinase [Litoreibacter arenae]|uniref:2-dehydro-3-deoxygalactonokinase n=1 Tax=Litoreibacter arenae DSM 19593 TaxID=1123360 RepID=S9RSE3_9RHOB|nr:2-dehydro-3-deoxygalactonokinase [Litoreibacter arenae]EPX80985.1 2-dehydro-3-deoxygalactonokinase [Litoreibacter arenae DSM 19593]
MAAAAWIAVDWGTSNLRVWAMDADDRVIASHTSDQGMGVLERDGFEAALLALIAPYLTSETALPVICCGMVGSRQGWAEAAYATAPCLPPDGKVATRVAAQDPRVSVFILPGVKQLSPPDVMRGEETQIAGFLHRNPDFDGVICLPGTHTKWARISAGEIVNFQTFMTGEAFALFSEQSVLRHSVTTDAFDADTFAASLADAMAHPQALASQLFGLRAASLVADLGAAAARSRLSGLLIGAELAAARPYWLGQNVAIIGASTLAGLYRTGLEAQGLSITLAEVEDMTLSGLIAAHHSLKEVTT